MQRTIFGRPFSVSGLFAIAFFLSSSLMAQAAGPNLIPNSSFETPDTSDPTLPASWRRGNWGTNEVTFTYPVAGVDGANAAKVALTSRTDGDAKWYVDPIPVTAGDVYTFTDQYQATVPSFVTLEYKLNTGGVLYQDILNPAAASSWTKAEATVTVPQNATAVTIYHLLNQVGSLSVDAYSFTKNDSTTPPPPPPPPTDPGYLIVNGSFEAASADGKTPQNWARDFWGTNQATFTYPVAGENGSKAALVSVSSYTDGDAKWGFTPVNVTPGQTLEYTGSYISNVPTLLTVEYQLSNGSYQYVDVAAPPAASTWKQVKATVPVPEGVKALTVYHLVNRVGKLTIDNARLSLATQTPPPPPPTDPNNLISNGNLATALATNPSLPVDWNKGGWGTNQASYTYPITGANGSKAIEVKVTSYTSGDAKWFFDPVTVTPGENYRFSEMYKSDVPTYLTAQFDMGNGTYQYVDLMMPAASQNWTALNVTISPPAGTQRMTVFHLLNRVGTLATGAYVLSPPTVPTNPLDKGMVSLSFDDGHWSHYEVARPILNQAGLKGSFYITTEFLDSDPFYMTKSQMLEISHDGHEIGSHVKTHPFLSQLSAEEMRNEIAGSKADLLAMGATPVTTLAYPYGDYNDAVVQEVKNAGYIGARSVNPGYNDTSSDHFLLMDQHVEVGVTPAQVQSYIDFAIANKKWLILEFHQQDYSGDQYSNTPETLQAIANYLQQKNVKTVTIDEGLRLIQQ